MKKNTINAGVTGALLLGGLAASNALFQSCSREEPAPRNIRAHTRLLNGVSHAEPADKAERYCSNCHGAALAGGAGLEPSCYKCHGRNWSQEPERALVSVAPADHDLVKGGIYRHKQTLFTPVGDCDACHGAALEGSAAFGGCELCHARLWEERAP